MKFLITVIIFFNTSPQTGNSLSRQILKTNQLDFFANRLKYL